MTAEIDETVLLTPHCNECNTSGGPRVSRADAEAWARDHDIDFHSPTAPEGEDG